MKESLIYGLLGGVISWLYLSWIAYPRPFYDRQTNLAVVDLQALISEQSQQLVQQLAKAHLSKTEESNNGDSHLPQMDAFMSKYQKGHPPSIGIPIQEAVDLLKTKLSAFAAMHNLILLAKGAVVAGDMPDKTAEVLKFIEEGEQS